MPAMGARTMKRRTIVAARWACCLAAVPTAAAGIGATDDWGREVTRDTPAASVVSLAPHLTELVYSAGAGERLVGVSAHCDYPARVASLPRVADYRSINYERLVMLAPELVLVWGAGLKHAALRRMDALGLNVWVSQPKSFDDVARNLEAIGRLTGRAAHAAREAERFRRRMNALRVTYGAGARRQKTLYIVWDAPLMAAGRDTWISAALESCGGVNVLADAGAGFAIVSRETALMTGAELVLHGIARDFGEDAVAALFAKRVETAYVHPDLVQRPSLRLADGVETICRLIAARRPRTSPRIPDYSGIANDSPVNHSTPAPRKPSTGW